MSQPKSLSIFLVFLFIFVSSSEANNPKRGRQNSGRSTRQPGLAKVCRERHEPPSRLPPCHDLTIQDMVDARLLRGIQSRKDESFLIPPWINVTLARKGQEFANKYLFSVMLSHVFGLFSATYPDGTKVLAFTTMSDTKESAIKRYIATLNHIFIWYKDTVIGDMKDEEDFCASLQGVRRRHVRTSEAVRQQLYQHGRVIKENKYKDYVMTTVARGPFHDDLEQSIPPYMKSLPATNWENGSYNYIDPFNVQMQALTQFAFVGYPVLFPERLGITDATDEDIWGFNHLWAVIGWAMGIPNKYNISLQRDLRTTRKLFKYMWESFTIPAFFHMNRDAKVIMELTLFGTQGVVSGFQLTPNLQLYLMMKHLMKIPAPRVKAELSIYDLFVDKLIDTMYLEQYKYNPIQREMMNGVVKGEFKLAGKQYFGKNFETQHSRARKVFWAKYE